MKKFLSIFLILLSGMFGYGTGTAVYDKLSGLRDVTISSVSNNDILVYSSTSSKWNNAQPSSISGRHIFIASSTSSAARIAGADYVCDGTADEVQINAAIVVIEAGVALGSTIELDAGTFTTSAAITITEAGLRLLGQYSGTRIKPANGSTHNIIECNVNTANQKSLCIEHIKFDGNRTGGATGRLFRNDVGNKAMQDINFEHSGFYSCGSTSAAVLIEDPYGSIVEDCAFEFNAGAALEYVAVGGGANLDAKIIGSKFLDNEGDGLVIGSSIKDVKVINNTFTIYNVGKYGINCAGEGCIFMGNNIWLSDDLGTVTPTGGTGIFLNGNDNIFSYNKVWQNVTAIAGFTCVEVNTGAANNRIEGNILLKGHTSASDIINNGTNTRIRNQGSNSGAGYEVNLYPEGQRFGPNTTNYWQVNTTGIMTPFGAAQMEIGNDQTVFKHTGSSFEMFFNVTTPGLDIIGTGGSNVRKFDATTGFEIDTFGFGLTTVAITAVGNSITYSRAGINLNPDGNYTLTSTPTILTSGVTAGAHLELYVAVGEANTVTLQDKGTLASSALDLGGANKTIGAGDIFEFKYNGTYWVLTKETQGT